MKIAHLLLCLAVLLCVPFVASAQINSYFHLAGPPGEPVSGGQDIVLTPADGTFQVNHDPTTNQLQLVCYTPTRSQDWQLLIMNARETRLQVGTYNNTKAPTCDDRAHPLLYIFGSGEVGGESGGCPTGAFIVHQVSYAPNGDVLTLWVTFTQTTHGGHGSLVGELVFNLDHQVTPLPVAPPNLNSFTMTSDPGDFVGQGVQYSFTPAYGSGSSWRLDRSNGVQFGYRPSTTTDFWSVLINTPSSIPLTTGAYTNIPRTSDATHYGFSVSGEYRACGLSISNIDVRYMQYDAEGYPLSLWLTFDQFCSGATAGLHGELKFNVPPNLPVPIRRTSWGYLKSMYR